MPGKRLIRLTSHALGTESRVRVYVYDDADHMRRDAVAYNGNTSNGDPEVMGVTQAVTDRSGRTRHAIIRLWAQRLSTEIVVHEMHHATTALYGAVVGDRVSRRQHFNHYNEPHAYLHGELVAKLVDRLHAYGYYDKKP